MIVFNCETEQFEEVYGIPQHVVFGWWLYATYEAGDEALADRLRRYMDF